jgi:hypothetical protein
MARFSGSSAIASASPRARSRRGRAPRECGSLVAIGLDAIAQGAARPLTAAARRDTVDGEQRQATLTHGLPTAAQMRSGAPAPAGSSVMIDAVVAMIRAGASTP